MDLDHKQRKQEQGETMQEFWLNLKSFARHPNLGNYLNVTL